MQQLPERVPPQNLEAEQSVLGSMLLEKEAIIAASEFLIGRDFYRDAHEKIFNSMQELSEKGEPVDVITLVENLRKKKILEAIGGVTYLTTLANSVPTAANITYYAKIVQEKSIARQLINTSTKIASQCYESGDNIEEMLDNAEHMILNVARQGNQEKFVPIKSVLMDTFEQLEKLYENKSGVTGLPTGFADLDNITSGFQYADLIIIAARPSMGKTTLAVNIAQFMGVQKNLPVAIFSLEMSKEQLVQRMLCSQAQIDAHRLRRGYLSEDDWPKLTKAVGPLAESPIFIDDTPAISVMEMRAKARRLQAEHGLKAIFVDYLQLMRGQGKIENRQQEISAISRSLKALAKELNVPVVALSQLSRAVEQRNDKRPILSDLLESGGIEANADLVTFIYRDDYYNPETEQPNITEVIIAKQRNGPVGKIELYFQGKYNRFFDLSKNHGQDAEAG